HFVHYSAEQVVTVATIGMIIGALPHLAVGRPARVSGMAARLLCIACVAYIFRPLASNSAVEKHWGLAVALMTALTVLALLLEAAIGRELGVHGPQLLELEYAALMHDIGQLSLHDPIPGGATVLVSRQDQQRIAELGADVIQQAQVLGSVAEIVRRQNEPYRDTDHAANGRAGLAEPYQG